MATKKEEKEAKVAKSDRASEIAKGNRIPQTQKELEAEATRRAGLTREEREAEDTAGIKSYDEKVSDYKQHFDNLGMSDPGTEARIQAMEVAKDRVYRDEDQREPELRARDEARIAHADELQAGIEGTTGKFGMIPPERKAANEALSDTLTDRKEHDEAEQVMTETGEKPNMARGGSEEAETGIDNPKAARAAVEKKKK